MSVLDARDVTVRYGGVTANDRVSMRVGAGQLVGLIGPNGAGKTTFIDALTGFAPLHGGSVAVAGTDVTAAGPSRRARLGLGRTFQSLELFEDLDVRSNLLVAAESPTWRDVLLDVVRPGRDRGVDAVVAEALDRVGLADVATALPGDLSHGQRTLVGVARALAMSPRVVLLDEPAAGLDTEESLALGVQLRRLVDGGIGAVLVDHDMGLVFSVCDEVHVLDFGEVIASGTPDEVRRHPDVIAAYLGSSRGVDDLGDVASTAAPPTSPPTSPPAGGTS